MQLERKDLDGFFSVFNYNTHGHTKIKEISDVVFKFILFKILYFKFTILFYINF